MEKKNTQHLKASDYFKERFVSCASTRKLAAQYGVSNAYISKLLGGKMDDPSLAVATKIVKTFNLDKQIIHLLYDYKGEKFVTDVISRSDDSEYDKETIIEKFVECYFSDLDNCILTAASSAADYNKDDEDLYFPDKSTPTKLSGCDATYVARYAYETTVKDTYTESKYDDEGNIVGEYEKVYDCPVRMDLTLFCDIFYLPTRQIAVKKYKDDCIRDFVNKFLFLLTCKRKHGSNFVFFTTSERTFDYIERYLNDFEFKNWDKNIVLVYYCEKQNTFHEYKICDSDTFNYSEDIGEYIDYSREPDM